jgi:hypothetical protein
MTFAEWRTLVKIAYQGGEPTLAALMRAVTDGARAITVRDVESDLPLAKSYRDSFRDARAALAGTRITTAIADVKTTVRGLMPIDDDTDAIDAILDNAIEAAYDDLNGTADRFDALLNEVAVELQRHIPFFTTRHENSYLQNSTGVTNEAFVSKVAPPAGMRLTQMWYGPYVAALAEGVTYEAEDYVESNGRIYEVVTGGVLGEDELGDGLTSTDYDDEALGDLVFRYLRPVILVPARAYVWADRARLRAGRFSGGPLYTLSEETDELWFYPPLGDDNRFVMEWVGVKESWEDADEVTFDAKAAACAAHFIKSHLLREIVSDSRRSAEAFALYQRELRGLVVDNDQRQAGMTSQVAAYNYWGSCRWSPCRISTSGGGSGSTVSTVSGFSDTITTLDLLAAVPTEDLDVPVFLTWWNADLETLVTYRLIAGTSATAPGIQRPNDYADGTNEKIWVAVG